MQRGYAFRERQFFFAVLGDLALDRECSCRILTDYVLHRSRIRLDERQLQLRRGQFLPRSLPTYKSQHTHLLLYHISYCHISVNSFLHEPADACSDIMVSDRFGTQLYIVCAASLSHVVGIRVGCRNILAIAY